MHKVCCLLVSAVMLTAGTVMAEERATIDQRLGRIERILDSQSLVEMMTRLEQIQRDLQLLRGEIEVQGHAIEGLKKRQRDLYLDIDQRLRKLETGTAAVQPTAPAPVPQVSPATPPLTAAPGVPVTTVPVAGERDAYQRAFTILKEGRYDQASTQFRQFLQTYPGSKYASNAQYWLGEAFYVTRQFPEGLTEFNKVVTGYPGSSKIGDAMLKIGFIHYELKEWDKVKTVLNDLIKRYPSTTVARLAENRLRRMKLEGH